MEHFYVLVQNGDSYKRNNVPKTAGNFLSSVTYVFVILGGGVLNTLLWELSPIHRRKKGFTDENFLRMRTMLFRELRRWLFYFRNLYSSSPSSYSSRCMRKIR